MHTLVIILLVSDLLTEVLPIMVIVIHARLMVKDMTCVLIEGCAVLTMLSQPVVVVLLSKTHHSSIRLDLVESRDPSVGGVALLDNLIKVAIMVGLRRHGVPRQHLVIQSIILKYL